MSKPFRFPLLAACLLALPAAAVAAPADDAALAAKLVGTWEGKWMYEKTSGRLVVKVSAASGASLKGRSTWYATVVGDFDDTFNRATVKDGKLKVVETTMDFEVAVAEDGTAMEGTWTSPAASGPMSLKKVDEKKGEKK